MLMMDMLRQWSHISVEVKGLYQFKKKWKLIIVLSAIVTFLLVYQAYNMSIYVKDYYKNSEITRIFLSLSDVKAGLDSLLFIIYINPFVLI